MKVTGNEKASCGDCDTEATRIRNSDDDEDNGDSCDDTMDRSNNETVDAINNGDIDDNKDNNYDCDVADELTDCNIAEVMNIKLEANDNDAMSSVALRKNDVIDTVNVEPQVFDDLTKADDQSTNLCKF